MFCRCRPSRGCCWCFCLAGNSTSAAADAFVAGPAEGSGGDADAIRSVGYSAVHHLLENCDDGLKIVTMVMLVILSMTSCLCLVRWCDVDVVDDDDNVDEEQRMMLAVRPSNDMSDNDHHCVVVADAAKNHNLKRHLEDTQSKPKE